MKVFVSSLRRRVTPAFTLLEAVIAITVLALFLMACFSSILMSRSTCVKAADQGVVMDFLQHYGEMIRGLPYTSVAPGMPINPMFNGQSGAPSVTIPPGNSWVSISTADYLAFHPELQALQSRNPQMRVTLTPGNINGSPDGITVRIVVAWDPPLNRGNRLQEELDIVRVRNM